VPKEARDYICARADCACDVWSGCLLPGNVPDDKNRDRQDQGADGHRAAVHHDASGPLSQIVPPRLEDEPFVVQERKSDGHNAGNCARGHIGEGNVRCQKGSEPCVYRISERGIHYPHDQVSPELSRRKVIDDPLDPSRVSFGQLLRIAHVSRVSN